MKMCPACNTAKPLTEYHNNKNAKDGHTNICKPCAKAKARKWELDNPEKKNATARAAYARNVEAERIKDRAWRDANREKDRAYKTKWYEANKEKQAAIIKKRREENPDKARADQKRRYTKWREAHLGRALEQQRKWRAANREKSNGASRKWARANREKVRARQQRWASENRARVSLYHQERRARHAGAPGEATPDQLQARIDYYGGRCYICNKLYDAIDHVVPLNKGGSNWPANLRPICTSDNSSKADKSLKEYLEYRAKNSA